MLFEVRATSYYLVLRDCQRVDKRTDLDDGPCPQDVDSICCPSDNICLHMLAHTCPPLLARRWQIDARIMR